MMHMLCMTKSPTYGVMISVPALLPAQNVHLATKRGHPRSVPVIRSMYIFGQEYCLGLPSFRHAGHKLPNIFGHIIPEEDDGFILKWSLPLDFVGILSASVPSANLKENSAYQESSKF